ncbi:MAG: hypothetical protein K0R22_1907 [Sporomusa sp.]|nr:hypothetical protein [Sporomusa sp.]
MSVRQICHLRLPNVICRIQNNSTNLMTSVEIILVNSSVSLGYSIIRNAILSGSLTAQTVYNLNENYPATTTTAISSAANTGISLNGGSTLLTQISLTTAFNPVIMPIIIQPGSSLYFSSSGALGLNITINVIFCEYN